MQNFQVSKEEALRIANQRCAQGYAIKKIMDGIPADWNIYGMEKWKAQSVWTILCSKEPAIGLTPSRAIIISQTTGEIIYDGSANDEG